MERREIVAFLVAPVVIPFVFFLPFPGSADGGANPSTKTLLELIVSGLAAFVILSFYTLPIAYLAEFVFGIAIWKVFKRYGIRSLPMFAAAGALMGWLVNVGMEAEYGNLEREPVAYLFSPWSTPYFLICIAAGLSSAVLFRLIMFSGAKAEKSRQPTT